MNEILIYGSIGSYGISDTDFISQLDKIKGQPAKIRFNCSGGDVFQGYAMYNAIKKHGQCDIYIDGLAASMASIIMLAGRKIYASENAMIMIHNPIINDFEADSKKLKSLTKLLEKIKQLALDRYSERTMIDVLELSSMLDDETWLTAQEALEMGFIDEITDKVLDKSAIEMKAKTPQDVFMSYKVRPATKPESLMSILGLSKDSDTAGVLSAISDLKSKSISLEAENKRIKKQLEEDEIAEAKHLTKLGIDKGVINKSLERVQLMAFKADFKSTKSDLLSAISDFEASQLVNKNHNAIREIILGSKGIKTSKDTVKPKNEWTLHDYRKQAPEELENNRELYNDLIKAVFKL